VIENTNKRVRTHIHLGSAMHTVKYLSIELGLS
jgi:hypothetical protein